MTRRAALHPENAAGEQHGAERGMPEPQRPAQPALEQMILTLQRTAGNAAVTSLLQRDAVKTPPAKASPKAPMPSAAGLKAISENAKRRFGLCELIRLARLRPATHGRARRPLRARNPARQHPGAVRRARTHAPDAPGQPLTRRLAKCAPEYRAVIDVGARSSSNSGVSAATRGAPPLRANQEWVAQLGCLTSCHCSGRRSPVRPEQPSTHRRVIS